MNKTDSYATGYFAFAQHDTPPPLVTLSTAKGLKLSYTKIFRFAQYDALSPRWALSLHASHTQRLIAPLRVTGWRASPALKMPALIVMPEISNNNISQPVSKVLLKKTNLLFKTKKLGNKKIRRVY